MSFAPPAASKSALWTGHILSALVILFLLWDSLMKFLKSAPTPLLSFVLAPFYIGAALWLGLYLREPRHRTLAPFRT